MTTKTHGLKAGQSTGTGLQALGDLPIDAQVGFDDTNPLVLQRYKVARGQLSTASALDTVVTGLASVVAVIATLESDPIDTCSLASAQIGDQAGTPAAGSVFIKTWKPTTGGASGNPTLVAATAFSKKVNWFAIGL